MCEAAERVSVCALQEEARQWEGRSVEVEWFVSRGFEDSGLFDPGCEGGEPVWVECGGAVERDAVFRRFDELLQTKPDRVVHARMAGRFFAANSEGATRAGYGHMGCCSLFVIERVVAVGEQARNEIDYRASVDAPEGVSSYGDLMVRGRRWDWLRWQQEAELAGNEWRLMDARRVAVEVLAERLNLAPEEVRGVREIEKRGAQIWFGWRDRVRRKRYAVVVSKPYFVAYSASDPRKAAWVVRALWETDAQRPSADGDSARGRGGADLSGRG